MCRCKSRSRSSSVLSLHGRGMDIRFTQAADARNTRWLTRRLLTRAAEQGRLGPSPPPHLHLRCSPAVPLPGKWAVIGSSAQSASGAAATSDHGGAWQAAARSSPGPALAAVPSHSAPAHVASLDRKECFKLWHCSVSLRSACSLRMHSRSHQVLGQLRAEDKLSLKICERVSSVTTGAV